MLQIDPDTDLETAKKKYRQLSLLVHPDRNPDDKDRADKAFDSTRSFLRLKMKRQFQS